jgi:uncharacterized protein (UPF0218 family)
VSEDPPEESHAGSPSAAADAERDAAPAGGDVVVELQAALRGELKEPYGAIFTEADALLAEAESPLVAVGDIVVYHLLSADRVPDVALVDGRTKREAVDEEVQEAIDAHAFDRDVRVENPPGTLSRSLLEALATALAAADNGETTVIVVDGEEDLAALPAIATAPTGASVVYGQPDEGMVLVSCAGEELERVRDLLQRMDGETERLWSLLGE